MSTPELIAPARLEELLGGAVPDTNCEARLQGLALELRAGAPDASAELRERVRAFGAPPPRRQLPTRPRHLALVLAALALAFVAAAVAVDRLGSGPKSEPLRATELGPYRGVPDALIPRVRITPPSRALEFEGVARAQHVDMWIALRVRDADRLSAAANSAMRITRELGGYVASSTVGTQGEQGRAEMSIRVPVEKVDDALFRLSRLGRITGQRVATVDRQVGIDRASRRIETLRRAVKIAQLRLDSGTLSAKERLALQIKLERFRSELASAQKTAARLASDAATADLSLVLQTQSTAAATKESAVGGTVGDALHVLGRAGAIALFAAIVLSPLVVLLALAWLLRRRRIRVQETALLEQARPGAPSPDPPTP